MFNKSYSFQNTQPIRFLTVVFLIFSLGFNSAGQNSKRAEKIFETAKSQFSNNNYEGAIKSCKQILKIDSKFKDAHLMLADVYSDMDSVNLEILHLNKAGDIGKEWLVVFRLGEAYYKIGNYSEALRYYNIYSDYMGIPEKRRFLLASKIASCKFAIHSIKNPVEFEPQNMGNKINTSDDEYWPTPSLDGRTLVFTRLLKDSTKRMHEDFFIAELDSARWNVVKPIAEVNTFDNEGAQTLSSDSKILFFTACNRPDGFGSCDIYFSKYEKGKWSTPANAGAPLNSQYWEAQPSFSSNSKFLYFSSNRPAGVGKKDIWRVAFKGFNDNGLPLWGKPENMGDIINTVGNEISPFIHANNINFYFASDTHVGMGGMDLFTAEIDNQGNVSKLKNMGYPINTHKDEIGLTISSIGDTAYFSSARNSENGLDIFSFNLEMGLRPTPVSYVKAKVIDAATKQPIQASIELVETRRAEHVENRIADENGEVMFCLQVNRNYSFSVSEPGYLFFSQSLQPVHKQWISDPFIFDIELEPIEIGAQMQLHNIYYETDSFRILPQSEPELQNLVAFLKNNSGLKVEIQGHTDSSGNPENNLVLSEKRAQSVVKYLTENGIAGSRLNYAGYGDTIPIESNDTEEGRALNRRTTIKIMEK